MFAGICKLCDVGSPIFDCFDHRRRLRPDRVRDHATPRSHAEANRVASCFGGCLGNGSSRIGLGGRLCGFETVPSRRGWCVRDQDEISDRAANCMQSLFCPSPIQADVAPASHRRFEHGL
jgi:hypothetical protein